MARLWQDGDYIDVSPFTDKELDTYSDNAIANKVVANELNKIENKIGEIPTGKTVEQQIDEAENQISAINSKLDKTTKEYFSHSHTFGNNLSNSDYKVTVPLPLADTKDGFMKVCILFSHVQDLYGRYEEYSIATNNNSRYLTPIKTFEKTASTQYNDYTLTIGNDTKNVSFDLDFKITTGSALNHILKVVAYY